MTASTAARTATSGRIFWIVLGALVLLAAVALGRGSSTGPPYSPRSTDPLGTLALVELLEERGSEVALLDPSDGVGPLTEDLRWADVVLVVRDQLDEVTRAVVADWTDGGGRLIVLDTSSPLVPAAPDAVTLTPQRTASVGVCTIEELADLDQITSGGFVVYDSSLAEADARCFEDEAGAVVLRWSPGAGTLIAIGGASLVTNERLADADNAVLLTRLVEGRDGGGVRVGVVYDPSLAIGTRTISELVPTSVNLLFLQLLVAAAALVWWQARRFGGVVDDARLVRLPGSLRVRAAAELRRRSGEHAEASEILGRRFERNVRRRHRLPADLPGEHLPATLSASSASLGAAPVDPTRFAMACGHPVAPDAAGLRQQLAAIDELSIRLDLHVADAAATSVPPADSTSEVLR